MKVDLETCFREFRRSALRVEALPEYAVGGQEEERLRAWRAGEPVPPRSLRNNAFLRMIAADTLAEPGRTWERVRVVDHPLTDYERFEFYTYPDSAAAGEQISVAVRAGGAPDAEAALFIVRQDLWLFDENTEDEHAVLMHYGPGGTYDGATLADADELAACRFIADVARQHAVPLEAYRAAMRRRGQAAA